MPGGALLGLTLCRSTSVAVAASTSAIHRDRLGRSDRRCTHRDIVALSTRPRRACRRRYVWCERAGWRTSGGPWERRLCWRPSSLRWRQYRRDLRMGQLAGACARAAMHSSCGGPPQLDLKCGVCWIGPAAGPRARADLAAGAESRSAGWRARARGSSNSVLVAYSSTVLRIYHTVARGLLAACACMHHADEYSCTVR
eukprot:COSAG01_NODE_982_length_12348_cov_6.696394_2_plen_198_part_00